MTDIDVKGFRRLAAFLPSLLIPNPKKQGPLVLKTNDGFLLQIDPSIDNGVELCLYQTGTYEKGILHFIESNYSGKGVFIDIGANIGLMSVFTAFKFPQAHVIAVEAHPKTMLLLKQNLELNHLKNVEPIELAIGNSQGRVDIYDNWHVNRGGASLVIKSEHSDSYTVQIKRLDDILNEEVPEMIKIDVEGVELAVLKGAEKTIRKHYPTLIIEVSDDRDNEHKSSQEIIDFVKSLGDYRIYKLKGGKERKSSFLEIRNSTEIPAHDNIICLPPSK